MAHINMGIVLKNKGQVDEAIAWYRKAIEIDLRLSFALLMPRSRSFWNLRPRRDL
jgi:hypothetical protein